MTSDPLDPATLRDRLRQQLAGPSDAEALQRQRLAQTLAHYPERRRWNRNAPRTLPAEQPREERP